MYRCRCPMHARILQILFLLPSRYLRRVSSHNTRPFNVAQCIFFFNSLIHFTFGYLYVSRLQHNIAIEVVVVVFFGGEQLTLTWPETALPFRWKKKKKSETKLTADILKEEQNNKKVRQERLFFSFFSSSSSSYSFLFFFFFFLD